MHTRLLGGLVLTVMALALLPMRANAGGWASVELDDPMPEVRAGQPLRLGFMVKQHGVTPIHSAFGMDVTPLLSARSLDTSETVSARAVKGVAIGHFVVDVTFPSAGRWEWEITPEPFTGTKLPTLNVAASAVASAASEAAIVQPSQASAAADVRPSPAQAPAEDRTAGAVRNGLGIGLLLLALAAAVVVARGGPSLRRTRSR